MDQRKLAHRDRGLSDPARRPARARRIRSGDRGSRQGRREDRARPGAGGRAAAHAGRGQWRHRGCRAPTLPACRAPPRTRPRSPARAPRIAATAPRWPSCLPGWTARSPARSTRSPSSPGWRRRRRQTGEETQMPLRDISFDTISGAGPNGAIMHYRVSRATNRKLQAGELFLLDSGAQYQDGTTDITRTVADRPADRGDARALHAGAEGHDRHFDAALPRRARAAPTSTPSPASRCGRHGSTSPTAPAMASAPICRCMKGRSASPGPAPKSCSPA